MCYICNRCGDVVDEIPTCTQTEEYWGRTVSWEEEDNCSCGGSYVEADECCLCGDYCCIESVDSKLIYQFEDIPEEWVAQSDFEGEDPYHMCEECLKRAIKEYNDSLKGVQ